jgi:Tol biopolymer transport system component
LLNNDLYLYDIEKGELKQLTRFGGYDYSGIFSPDGGRIFFISGRSGRGAFYAMDVDGRNFRQVTNLRRGSYEVPVARSDTLSWSGAKNVIVYEAQGVVYLNEIRSIRPDGSDARKLGLGAAPQLVRGGRAVAFIGPDRRVRVVGLE